MELKRLKVSRGIVMIVKVSGEDGVVGVVGQVAVGVGANEQHIEPELIL